MCYATDYKVQFLCTVGDLTPGQRYRLPNGGEVMVVNTERVNGTTRVVDLATGEITLVDDTVQLGHDRQDRLYAARRLNPPFALPVDPNTPSP